MSSTASKRKVKKRAATTSRKPRHVTGASSSASKSEAKPHVSTAETLFADLGFPPEEARVLTIKSDLCTQILRLVRERGHSQKDLAKIWGKPQPRVSEVLNGKISLVSIDTLVTYLSQLGADVTLKVEKKRAS